MHEGKEAKRFFVTVVTENRMGFMNLPKYGYDLFEESAGAEEKRFTIEGLLTLEQIGRLVEDGFHVLVKDEASKKSRARYEMMEFDEWLKLKKKGS